MFAHVHGTGRAYYSHAGLWIKLLSENHEIDLTEKLSITKPNELGLDITGNTNMTGNLSMSGDLHISNKVGIGVIQPSEKLDVLGSVKISDTLILGNLNKDKIRFLGSEDSSKISATGGSMFISYYAGNKSSVSGTHKWLSGINSDTG